MSLLSTNPAIASKIDKLWNAFWSGGISNPLTAIEQITYLLFMRKLDDNDTERKANAEFSGEQYQPMFEGTYVPPQFRSGTMELASSSKTGNEIGVDKHSLRWSQIKRIPKAEDMLNHVQQYAFPFIKEHEETDSPFSRHMAQAVFMIPKPSLLKEAIGTIDEIFEELEKDAREKGHDFQDIQGDVYEMLLKEIASAGKNGQFRTPRHIIKLLVELVDPKLGQRIVDPACGTGGFLLGAYHYLITHLNADKDLQKLAPDEDGFVRTGKSPKLTEEVKTLLGQSLQGYDIDQTMVRLGLMNLMMHGIDNPQIDYKDTLSKGFHEAKEYKVVLANPPFTGNIDKGDIHEELQLKTTKTELLFIERIFNLLEMGGTAGIVIPQGVLFGSGKAFIEARKIMVEQSELKAVVSMPSGVFKPYAGVSTAILIFTKGGTTENVWFYNMERDGYSMDDKRTPQKLENGEDDYGDLQDIVREYKNRPSTPLRQAQGTQLRARDTDTNQHSTAKAGDVERSRNAPDRKGKHFLVPKAEIAAENYDLSFSRYKEEVFEEIKYDKPQDILDRLIGTDGQGGLEQEITDGLKELRKML